MLYYMNTIMIDSNKNNIKQTWKILNQVINKQKMKTSNP